MVLTSGGEGRIELQAAATEVKHYTGCRRSGTPRSRATRQAFEGLRDAAQHLMAANGEIQQAGAAIVRATNAALAAKEEHEDLRAMRDRLDRGDR